MIKASAASLYHTVHKRLQQFSSEKYATINYIIRTNDNF